MVLMQATLVLLAALGLIKLGSLAVWVVVLGLTIKALLALIVLGIVGTVGYVVWKRYGKTIADRSAA